MNELTKKDKIRLDELARLLKQINDESTKDQLVGAAKWAAALTIKTA